MDFIPHNDLEQELIAVTNGEADAEAFVLRLLDQQVFMPVLDEKDAIQGFQRSTQAQPLIVADEDGEQVLVLFTSPERAKPMVADFPDYSVASSPSFRGCCGVWTVVFILRSIPAGRWAWTLMPTPSHS